MNSIRGIVVLVLLTIATYAIATEEPPPKITAAWGSYLKDGDILIAAGQPRNHAGFEEPLKQIWSSATASSGLSDIEFIEVSVEKLEQVFGNIGRDYIAFYGNEAHMHRLVSAHVMVWGCDGSLVPVLNLGPSQFKADPWEWGIRVLSVSRLPDTVDTKAAPKELIPESFYGPLSAPEASELWFDGKKHFVYIDENPDHSVDPEILLVDSTTGKRVRMIRKSLFDARC